MNPPMFHDDPGRQHYGLTLLVLVAAALAFALSQTMVVPAIPDIQREFGSSQTTTTFVLTAFLLTASVLTPILGRLGDMFGKERVLVLVLCVFAVGSLKLPLLIGTTTTMASFAWLAVFHESHLSIYVGSALLGIGIGFAFASMANLIVNAVDQTEVGVATGINAIMRTIGASLGGQISAAVIAGQLAANGLPEEGGFVFAFVISAVGLALATVAAAAIPTDSRRRHKLPGAEPAPLGS